MSIITELDALKDHLTQACTAALTAPAPHTLTRPATVLNRDVENYYAGTFPLVEVMFLDRNVILTAGSQGSDLGENFGKPNTYAIRIRSAVDETAGITVDGAQTELFTVVEAIESWFAVIAHRVLPDNTSTRRVLYAGPPFRWRGNVDGMYQQADGTLGQVLAGSITVLGLTRAST